MKQGFHCCFKCESIYTVAMAWYFGLLLLAAAFGFSMKISDLLNEHGLRWFRYDAVVFGLLWGLLGALLVLADDGLANAILAMTLAFIVQLRIDYLNHALGAAMIIIAFLFTDGFYPLMFFVFFASFVVFGSLRAYIGDVRKKREGKNMALSCAEITTLEELSAKKSSLGTIVAVSGGFDPIHPGHISYIQEAKKLGDTLVVIVNGDAFLRNKKGKPFQDLETRCSIVSAVRGVDFVMPFEIENDQTVCRALEVLKPHIFANGGDRKDSSTIPEWETCQAHGIQLVTGVGISKSWSSSSFLKSWEEHIKMRRMNKKQRSP